jgi:hypothetical protein
VFTPGSSLSAICRWLESALDELGDEEPDTAELAPAEEES